MPVPALPRRAAGGAKLRAASRTGVVVPAAVDDRARRAAARDSAPAFHRGDADAASLQILCESLRFGPMTRRRLHAAAGIELAAVTGSD